jgi:hypothetical protein
MVFLLYLGAVTVCLSVVYIVVDGASLISPPSDNDRESPARRLASQICTLTYNVVFWINGSALALLVLCAPPLFAVGAVQVVVGKVWGLAGIGLTIVGFVIQLLFIAAVLYLVLRFVSIVERSPKVGWVIGGAVLSVLLGLAFAGIQATSYTLELYVEKQVVDPSDGKPAVFFVKLGGATGDVRAAKVHVWKWHSTTTDPANTFDEFAGPLALVPLGDGQYVCSLPAAKVVPGVFQAKLTYGSRSIGLQYPYFHGDTSRVAGFIVIGEEIDKD